MAHCHTKYPPTHHAGEYNLAKQLVAIPDQRLHLWFSLDYIPSVRDIDLLIYHELAGVFVVEVKAVPLGAIEKYGYSRCQIQGRKEDYGPCNQAQIAQEYLRDYLRPRMDIPFLVSTACWPKISREHWNKHWDDPRVCGDYANSMLFEEDFSSGVDVLIQRLKYIYRNPPIRTGAQYAFQHKPTIIEQFNKALSVESQPRIAPSDQERLRIIERQVTDQAIRDVPAADGINLIYTGHPGTGKTFRLLRIGFHHLRKGRSVLYICFNKVLAADVNRLLAYSPLLHTASNRFEVIDVYRLLSRYVIQQGLEISSENPDEWGQLIVEDMKSDVDKLLHFDTILIDEAQDMCSWQLELAELHAKTGATIVVAAGAGQELYGNSSEWLAQFKKRKSVTIKALRRNFRNTRPVFAVAQSFYEEALDPKKIPAVLRRFKVSKGNLNSLSIQFERPEGQPPSIQYIDNSSLANEEPDDFYYSIALDEIMKTEYERILRDQLDRLRDDERPIDLLVLVPSSNAPEQKWASAALNRIVSKDPNLMALDYTDESNRRFIAQPNMVRLCTFHSARGIEGTRVVVFGMEFIENLAENTNTPVKHIGYIALSRSIFECTLVFTASTDTLAKRFIEECLKQFTAGNVFK